MGTEKGYNDEWPYLFTIFFVSYIKDNLLGNKIKKKIRHYFSKTCKFENRIFEKSKIKEFENSTIQKFENSKIWRSSIHKFNDSEIRKKRLNNFNERNLETQIDK